MKCRSCNQELPRDYPEVQEAQVRIKDLDSELSVRVLNVINNLLYKKKYCELKNIPFSIDRWDYNDYDPVEYKKITESVLLEELMQFSESELLSIRNFGRKSLRELKEFLRYRGLYLKVT